MSNRERAKGRAGEAEVRALLAEAGLHAEALGGRADQADALIVAARLEPVFLEVKRQETARPWQWWQQAAANARGSAPAVAFRRSRSPWLVMLDLEHFARLLK